MEENSKRLSRRRFLQVAATGAGLLVTAACAPPAPQRADMATEADSGSMQETVELRLAYWGFEVEQQGLLQEKFMETYPHIKLQEEITGWGTYWQKMLTSTAAGESPDIMHHSPTMCNLRPTK